MSEFSTFASSIIEATSPDGAGDAVAVSDISHLTKLVVKTTAARPDGLGPAFGSSEVHGGSDDDRAVICGTRPGEWTVIGSAESAAQAVSSTTAHVVDITHGRVLIEVAGANAPSALEKVCSLDWSDDMMPDGAVTSASVAKVSCDVIRHDKADGTLCYWLAADRSFGQYLHDALVDAADEFNG